MQPTVTGWMDRDGPGRHGRAARRSRSGSGNPPTTSNRRCDPHPEVLVKIIRYPAPRQRATDGDVPDQGVGLHNDSGLLSFILQDDVGGLQVQIGDELVDATPMPGALVLNIGEMLQIATDGYLRATKHRVVSPPAGRQRISVAYFLNPAMEATFEQIPLAGPSRGRGTRRRQRPARRHDLLELRRQLAQVPRAVAPGRGRDPPPGSARPFRLTRAGPRRRFRYGDNWLWDCSRSESPTRTRSSG